MNENLVSKKNKEQMSFKEIEECIFIAKFLTENWVDKKTIAVNLGVDERTARDRVAKIAKKYPILSISTKKGYKRATCIEDLKLAKQTIAEHESRIKELRKRIRPLKKFIKECELEYGDN